MVLTNLERREHLMLDWAGPLEPDRLVHYLWVVGPHGAASTWFEETKATLGHSTGGGITTYSLYPRDVTPDWFDEMFPALCHNPGPSEFLNGAYCWSRMCEEDTPKQVIDAYDEGDGEVVWAWLEAYCESDLGDKDGDKNTGTNPR